MEYRKFSNTYYIRMDKGDEIISVLLELCKKEGVSSAIFSGIGGCDHAEVQAFIPEEKRYESEELKGMLELISLNGDIVTQEDGSLFCHAHGAFSKMENGKTIVSGGHLKSVRVSLTAEIELRPVIEGTIKRKAIKELGIGVWDF